jgi:hypothetical protein
MGCGLYVAFRASQRCSALPRALIHPSVRKGSLKHRARQKVLAGEWCGPEVLPYLWIRTMDSASRRMRPPAGARRKQSSPSTGHPRLLPTCDHKPVAIGIAEHRL